MNIEAGRLFSKCFDSSRGVKQTIRVKDQKLRGR